MTKPFIIAIIVIAVLIVGFSIINGTKAKKQAKAIRVISTSIQLANPFTNRLQSTPNHLVEESLPTDDLNIQ